MHRKLLPVCLEGKYVAIVQQTPSTQKIQKRDLLIVQNRHSQFFVLMLVKRSEYSIIFSLFLLVVIMGVTMLSKSMKNDNTQKKRKHYGLVSKLYIVVPLIDFCFAPLLYLVKEYFDCVTF